MVQITQARRSGRGNGGGFPLQPFITLLICCVGLYPVAVIFSYRFFAFRPSSDNDHESSSVTAAATRNQQAPLNNNPRQTAVAAPNKNVAFVISLMSCGSEPFMDAAAVLIHSIHRASVHGSLGGTYDYQMYAIYHPDAEQCALPLADLGYALLKRRVFVEIKDIQGEHLRQHIGDNGCCGEKELIKLEALTLTQHSIAVHLDLDALVLKPMDEIFNWMLYPTQQKPVSDAIMWPNKPWPQQINALFTMDYNMAMPQRKYQPVQGGFLVLRPSLSTYEELRQIVLKGDFRPSEGWGGQVGMFYGGMTIQGLIPYYFQHLHPGQSVELSRCIYNQMADNPRTGPTVKDIVSGDCRTGQADCEDCRSRPLEDVVTAHFTLCQKPWTCQSNVEDAIQHRLCRKLTAEWFKIRSELEAQWGRPPNGVGEDDIELFRGHCKNSGKDGYIPIAKPYQQQ